ncbi:MAG: hypothetical protein IJ646_14030 [Clostridia bacterium]|nr:hypothetical protein [Clostridia bacterium]
MTLNEALARALRAYEHYYTVVREGVEPPFQAEALFLQHDERYFISRSIRLSESDAREHIYFAAVETLDEKLFHELDEAAWSRGLALVKPEWGHRGSDIGLVILTNRLEPEAARAVRAASRSKGYAFSLKGWTNYRLIAMELPTGTTASNRLGRQMEETLRNIIQSKGIVT